MTISHEPLTGSQAEVGQTVHEESGWRALAIGAGGFLLGILPLILIGVATGIRETRLGGGFRFSIDMFATDFWTRLGALVMAGAFTALGLQLHRARRGPIPARPAVFVVGVGLLLVVVPALPNLRTSVAITALAIGLVVVQLLYSALGFWLVNSADVATFTVGVGMVAIPAFYWLAGLVASVWPEVGQTPLVNLWQYIIAVLVGLALGRCGWNTPRRVWAWVITVLWLTLGWAAMSGAQFMVLYGWGSEGISYFESVFWGALLFSVRVVGVAMVVGLITGIALTRHDRERAEQAPHAPVGRAEQ